jgi:Arc/MetJ-type ribon-helix-helix transcriptional regulator
MTITLGPEQERVIAEAMQTGAYENADEVIHRPPRRRADLSARVIH